MDDGRSFGGPEGKTRYTCSIYLTATSLISKSDYVNSNLDSLLGSCMIWDKYLNPSGFWFPIREKKKKKKAKVLLSS